VQLTNYATSTDIIYSHASQCFDTAVNSISNCSGKLRQLENHPLTEVNGCIRKEQRNKRTILQQDAALLLNEMPTGSPRHCCAFSSSPNQQNTQLA